IVGVKDEDKFKELADKYSIKFEKIGLSIGEVFRLNDIKINLSELKNIYFNEFSKVIKSED
ncbi:hypothetical protein, partial [Campylobacter fetus]|uniref:hypothetical protein n=1 Tax=Campylobacter fetus TaxID=196 RepID=UPI000ADD9BFD